VQTAVHLAAALRDGVAVERGTPPPDLSARVPARRPGRPDVALGGGFGAVLRQPRATCRPGDTVSAQFVGAYPNNDLRRGGTYLQVQQQAPDGSWVRVADDGDWSTRLHWRRPGRWSAAARAASVVTVEWSVPAATAPGRYRLVWTGDVLELGGGCSPVTGTSDAVEVVADT
jgi:neutral ceramidase